MKEITSSEVNSRYLAHCEAHGHKGDPDAQLAADKVAWPGGYMTGYILWITGQRQAFLRDRSNWFQMAGQAWEPPTEPEFDEWLDGQAAIK